MRKNRKAVIWGNLFVLFLLIMGIVMAYGEALNVHEYLRLEETAAAVTAKVTKKTEGSDGNGDPTYTMYITYSYNGVTYHDVYYQTFISDNLFGKTLTVEIDPENPRNLRPDKDLMLVLGPILTTMWLGFLLLLVLCCSRAWGLDVARKSWNKIYNSPILSLEAIRHDLNENAVQEQKFAVRIFWFLSALLLAVSVFFYVNHQALTVVYFYGIALALSFLVFRRASQSAYHLQIQPVTLQSVETARDSKNVIWHFDTIDWEMDDSIFVTRTPRLLSSCQPGHKFYIAVQSWRNRMEKEQHKVVRLYDAGEFHML